MALGKAVPEDSPEVTKEDKARVKVVAREPGKDPEEATRVASSSSPGAISGERPRIRNPGLPRTGTTLGGILKPSVGWLRCRVRRDASGAAGRTIHRINAGGGQELRGRRQALRRKVTRDSSNGNNNSTNSSGKAGRTGSLQLLNNLCPLLPPRIRISSSNRTNLWPSQTVQ